MTCELKLVSSLEKIFFDKPMDIEECTSGSMLKNEIYSFQLVGWGEDDACLLQRLECKLKVKSELEPYIKINSVGYVPSILPIYRTGSDDDYITKTPGLFPDSLHSVKDGEIELVNRQARAFWISVEPESKITGTYPIILQVFDKEDNLLNEATFILEIINAELPQTEVRNTGWFHGDCIAKLHNVDIQSEEYFEIVKKYLAVYVKFGHNMILTPIFTPALDTVVGGERLTNQLVNVKLENGKYSFEFNNLKRWIDLCQDHGIRFFEMAHLFTQWGAECTPKIMATVDGEYKRIFGWETKATSDEYREFLDAFMPELVSFLKQEGVMERCYFHISDEPIQEHEEHYRKLKQMVTPYVPDLQWIDALSDYSFYEKGIVSTPVVSNDHLHTFIEHNAKNLWTYYCMAQIKDVSQRFIATPSYRNRILGYQLYKYEIKGFLHYGYNFWFSQLSRRVINPYIDTTAGNAFPAGDAFVVYPLDEDGEVVCSLRLYVFNEGLQDMRALELLESLTDKETVRKMLGDIQGFTDYPRTSSYILQLREKINKKIKELC